MQFVAHVPRLAPQEIDRKYKTGNTHELLIISSFETVPVALFTRPMKEWQHFFVYTRLPAHGTCTNLTLRKSLKMSSQH